MTGAEFEQRLAQLLEQAVAAEIVERRGARTEHGAGYISGMADAYAHAYSTMSGQPRDRVGRMIDAAADERRR